MENLRDNKELRADVFTDLAAFQEGVLRATVRTAKRRRSRQVAVRCAFILSALFLSFQFRRTEPPPITARLTPDVPRRSHELMRSDPFNNKIVSVPLPSVQRIRSSMAGLILVSTANSTPLPVRTITDEQLFSFFQGKAVALVRPALHEAELVFPDDSQMKSSSSSDPN
jgi:hypothetical protein